MSLRIWLPLLGNLNNHGTTNVTVTNSNASVDTAGKIGSCYSFNGSTSRLDLVNNDFPNILNGDFSICFWLYSNDSSGRSIYFGNWSAPSGSFFNIEKNGSEKLRFYWNGNPDLVSTNLSIPNTTWCHITITRKANTVKFYLNGVLKDTFTSTLNGSVPTTATTFYLGKDNRAASDATALNGKLNDFRLYDNELSQKQIKEISKALVVHFPLNGNGLGGTNLCGNTNTASIDTNTFGYSEQTGGSTRTIEYDGGTPCVKVTRNTTAHSGWAYMWYNNLKSAELKTSTVYTLSFDAIGSGSGTIGFSGFMNGNATNQLSQSTETIQGSFNSTSWSHMVFRTATKSSFADLTVGGQCVYMSCGFMNNTSVWIKIKNMKVEEGTVDTGWTPNPSDAAYSTMGFNNNIEIDISGYKRNGTRSGTITAVTDTARYTSSTYLTDPAFITYQAPVNMYYATYSFWFKFSSFTGYGAIHIPAANPSSGDAPWFSCNTESVQLWAYFGGNSPSYTKGLAGSLSANTWYHAVYVWNNGVAQWYLNGAKHGNAVTYTGKTYIPNTGNATIGDSYTGSSWSGTPFTGQVSDFRLYATVLSDADIKELYEAGASIDDKGSVYSYEFNEK